MSAGFWWVGKQASGLTLAALAAIHFSCGYTSLAKWFMSSLGLSGAPCSCRCRRHRNCQVGFCLVTPCSCRCRRHRNCQVGDMSKHLEPNSLTSFSLNVFSSWRHVKICPQNHNNGSLQHFWSLGALREGSGWDLRVRPAAPVLNDDMSKHLEPNSLTRFHLKAVSSWRYAKICGQIDVRPLPRFKYFQGG